MGACSTKEQNIAQTPRNQSENNFGTMQQKLHLARSTGSLALGNMELETIPDGVTEFQLRVLDVAHNGIKELPEAQPLWENIKLLNMSYNKIREIPSTLLYVTVLKADHNKIEELPEDLQLPYVSAIHLSYNKLEKLPSGLINYACLTSINISNNHFSEFPEVLAQHQVLETIDISYNQIKELPEKWDAPQLQWLNLNRNQVSTLPKLLLELENISRISLQGNQITPEELEQLPGAEEYLAKRAQRKNKSVWKDAENVVNPLA